MGAHHHVHGAVGQSGQGLTGLLIGNESAEHRHLHREGCESFHHGREVLTGQQGGRHQERHLLTILNGLKDGPQGNLGLAKSHVGTDQSVHGPIGLHVDLHFVDGPLLVRCLGEGEEIFHFNLPLGV